MRPPLEAAPPLPTLAELMRLTFWEMFGVAPGCSAQALRKAFQKLALKHHPDKGGSSETFKYISMAHEVLSDPEKRAEYNEKGKEPFVGSFRPPSAESRTVPTPHINKHFMSSLLNLSGSHSIRIGHFTLAEYLEKTLTRKAQQDVYDESALAQVWA